jgi:hypothetical protein
MSNNATLHCPLLHTLIYSNKRTETEVKRNGTSTYLVNCVKEVENNKN